MRKDPASEVYDVPQYSYFEFGNNFTGSYGKLSYKITPGEDFTVQIWHSRLCSDLAEMEEEQKFPMTKDGFHEMLRWLGKPKTTELGKSKIESKSQFTGNQNPGNAF